MKKLLYIMTTTLLVAGFMGCSKFDDSDLWNDVNDLKQRVQTLEEKVNQMNSEIGTMQTIVTALNSGRVITDVVETTGGYTITFSGGSTITVNHGSDGAPGAPGANAPVIGVGEDGGVYYWTITSGGTTSWLTNAQGEKLPVTGATPVMGVDAGGYWTVDGVQITDTDGQPVKASGEDGDSFFSNVTQDENAVTFTLVNGTVIVVPKAENLQLTVSCSGVFLKYGETATYTVNLTGTGSVIITKPDGWRANIQEGILTVTAPPQANTYAEKDGTISITVVGKNATVNKTLAACAYQITHVIDFEDSDVLNYLANNEHGDNLYSGYVGADRYYGYYDIGSELYMMINDPYQTSDPDFWSGGIAISQWNNMTAAGHTNQCSVYYSDPVTSKGGYQGSNTFAVHFGYKDETGYGTDGRSYITFDDNSKDCVFDHFYVTNNTYAVLSMKNGDSFAKAHTYENKLWFKLVIEGIAKDGSTTGKIDVYLSDFRTPTSPGIITEWIPVDLRPLGKVTAIRFDMQGNDDNGYGLATPAYFCFDNLAVGQ